MPGCTTYRHAGEFLEKRRKCSGVHTPEEKVVRCTCTWKKTRVYPGGCCMHIHLKKTAEFTGNSRECLLGVDTGMHTPRARGNERRLLDLSFFSRGSSHLPIFPLLSFSSLHEIDIPCFNGWKKRKNLFKNPSLDSYVSLFVARESFSRVTNQPLYKEKKEEVLLPRITIIGNKTTTIAGKPSDVSFQAVVERIPQVLCLSVLAEIFTSNRHLQKAEKSPSP